MRRPGESRSYARITRPVLDRLSQLAAEDRQDFFSRRPRWATYSDRIICVALCQGAALHYVDPGRGYGVRDLDVYTFYAAHEVGEFPYRRRAVRRFDRVPFAGRKVDLMGRSLREREAAPPIDAIQRYLSRPRSRTPRELAKKAVVLIDPSALRGIIAWPPG